MVIVIRAAAEPEGRYGTGAVRLNENRAERVGGIKYTIKDGIVYDAKQLLADVAAMVEKQKKERSTKTTTPAAVQGR